MSWPGADSGAIVRALNFWLLLHQGKSDKEKLEFLLHFFFKKKVEKKEKDKEGREKVKEKERNIKE